MPRAAEKPAYDAVFATRWTEDLVVVSQVRALEALADRLEEDPPGDVTEMDRPTIRSRV